MTCEDNICFPAANSKPHIQLNCSLANSISFCISKLLHFWLKSYLFLQVAYSRYLLICYVYCSIHSTTISSTCIILLMTLEAIPHSLSFKWIFKKLQFVSWNVISLTILMTLTTLMTLMTPTTLMTDDTHNSQDSDDSDDFNKLGLIFFQWRFCAIVFYIFCITIYLLLLLIVFNDIIHAHVILKHEPSLMIYFAHIV